MVEIITISYKNFGNPGSGSYRVTSVSPRSRAILMAAWIARALRSANRVRIQATVGGRRERRLKYSVFVLCCLAVLFVYRTDLG
ncbi:hypothetical protein RRG08_052121 [Elysia crispata]|uniref:Uncharacterized protein n=1 Tax=Elysia crispata TaxID=231223 RepID=A0AAE1DS80_9GAST|nr:hypothetical protein RRG08_052121 [Elysia crispata]